MQLWLAEHFFFTKRVPAVLHRYPFVKKKVFNWSELHFSEVTYYKIHILGLSKIQDTFYKQARHNT